MQFLHLCYNPLSSVSSFKTNGSEVYISIFAPEAGNPFEGRFMILYTETYVIGNHWLEAVFKYQNTSLVKHNVGKSRLKRVLVMFCAILSNAVIVPIASLMTDNEINQLLFLKFTIIPFTLFLTFLSLYAYRKLSKILIKLSDENDINLDLYKKNMASSKFSSIWFTHEVVSGAQLGSPRFRFTSIPRETIKNYRVRKDTKSKLKNSTFTVRKDQKSIADEPLETQTFSPTDSVNQVITKSVQSKPKEKTQTQKQWEIY
eukprot:snap_masked-scaffold_18-processed-gene-4.16-mRNA-1 protein AED:1.00 eAED:1.00 QI:0/0/0/0/1/1/4/0/258